MAGDVSIQDCDPKVNEESSDKSSESTTDEDSSIPADKGHHSICIEGTSAPGTSSKATNTCESSFRDNLPLLQDIDLDILLNDCETPPEGSSKQLDGNLKVESDQNRAKCLDRKLVTKNLEESFNYFKTPDKTRKSVADSVKPKGNSSKRAPVFNLGAGASKQERYRAFAAEFVKSEEAANMNIVYHEESEDDTDESIYDDNEIEENSPICCCISSSHESEDEHDGHDDLYQELDDNSERDLEQNSSNNVSNEEVKNVRKRKTETPSKGDQKRRLLSDSNVNGIGGVSTSSDQERSPVPSNSSSSDFADLNQWLSKFNSWSNSEQLKAIDALIGSCASEQVRHMMKAIEPIFQRDFISLLPRELALGVLGYLDAADLLKAAQTCRYWRFLADDNLIWKEQCRKAGITQVRRRTRSMPTCLSPWKVSYMHQYLIENNWLKRPLRTAKVLKGHDDHVITCLQFYGNKILSGSDDTTLKVWSAVTGKCLRTLVGHTGGVWSSQMVGRVIVSGSTDRTLRVWDARTGECLKILIGHISTIRCMHLHQDRVVSGSRDATLRVWSISDGRCLQVLVGHMAAVRCVQYDGKYIVSGAYDYFVKVWNPETGDCLHTLSGHTNRVYSLQFDGVHVVSGSLDTSIRVWDVESGALKHTLMGHQSLTSGMELRSNILVSGNADSTVKIWDITTGRCLHTLTGPDKHQSAVTCVQSNKRFVITSSDDGTVKLWDLRTGEFIRNLITLASGGSGGVVWRIRASSTKLVCAVGSRNGTEETKLLVFDFDVPGACQKCVI